jgi:hypothetical protein
MFWLPIIGPIIQGIVSIFNKRADTQVAINKTNRESDVAEARVSQQIIETTNDSIGVRLSRDLIVFPVAVWTALLVWDTIIAESFLKAYMWHVASFEKTGAPYLPYAVIVFLLGNIGINTWKRK